MTLKLEYRRSYGHDRFYPQCERSRLLIESIADRKCVELTDVHSLIRMGFDLQYVDRSGKPVSLCEVEVTEETETERKAQ